ncbi:uncharacterized protein TNIN_406861 [Trichonephila inaurata madagascariensis]|uniref:Prokineticin domain-containing protein n=1 Tax=Trichonephila inaurata madagascariensis TaxID=2747483 RepID=A0A8X7C8Y3_9ARAC|nr:uncharacterized protein TNIN_406861 [Trichonephila inaurata madagascariensis]
MKVLVVALVLVACLALGESKRCKTSEDCAADECCVARGVFIFRRGNCKKLAQKEEACSTEEDTLPFMDEQYIGHCPCVAGLSCEPTEIKDLPFIGTVKIDERCVEGDSQTTPAEPEPEPEPETEAPVEE